MSKFSHNQKITFLCCASVLILQGVFLYYYSLAIAHYPGGNYFQEGTIGYDFWRNYWCDLALPVAINGKPNYGAEYAAIGFVIFNLSMYPIWLLFAFRVGFETRLGAVLTLLSTFSVVISMWVPFTSRMPDLHALALLLNSVPGLISYMIVLVICYRFKFSRPLFYLGVLVFAVSAVNLLQYLEARSSRVETMAIPTVQKISTILLAIWVVLFALIAPVKVLREGK